MSYGALTKRRPSAGQETRNRSPSVGTYRYIRTSVLGQGPARRTRRTPYDTPASPPHPPGEAPPGCNRSSRLRSRPRGPARSTWPLFGRPPALTKKAVPSTVAALSPPRWANANSQRIGSRTPVGATRRYLALSSAHDSVRQIITRRDLDRDRTRDRDEAP